MLLALSLFALLAGPVVARSARSRPEVLTALDAFVLVSIGGLVFLEILPVSLRIAGPAALVAVLAGVLGPGLVERYLHRAARRAHFATLIFALGGLAVHASLDGVALGDTSNGRAGLAIAVLLHRLPEG